MKKSLVIFMIILMSLVTSCSNRDITSSDSILSENARSETQDTIQSDSDIVTKDKIQESDEILSQLEEKTQNNQEEFGKAKDQVLTQEQKKFYIETYINMNPFTYQSWSDPEQIESFRYGTFYGNNAINDSKYDPQQFSIDDTLQYEIPANIFEEYIKIYFKVSSDFLRTSNFYNSDKGIYTGFLAGGGMPVKYEVESVQIVGSNEEIICTASSEDGIKRMVIGIEHSGENFKFVYVKQL